MGARDMVSLQHMEHLQTVVLRELEYVRQFRALNEAQTRLQQLEQRHDSLLQDTAEAVAYLQEGIHIRVNPSYAKLFGYDDSRELEGLPLMDMIGMDDRPKLKQQLRDCSKGKIGREPFPYKGLNAGGATFPIKIRFSISQLDDEDCIEVLVTK